MAQIAARPFDRPVNLKHASVDSVTLSLWELFPSALRSPPSHWLGPKLGLQDWVSGSEKIELVSAMAMRRQSQDEQARPT